MAITIGSQQKQSTNLTWNGSSYSEDISYTVPVGTDLLLVRITGVTGTPLGGVTWDGDSLTERVAATGGSYSSVIMDLVSPNTGTLNLTIDSLTVLRNWEVTIESLSGVDTTSHVRDTGSDAAWGGTPSVALTTVSGDMAVDTASNNQTPTIGSGQTQSFYDLTNNSFGSYEESTGTTTTMSWSFTGDFQSLVAAAYIPSSSTKTLTITGITNGESLTGLDYMVFDGQDLSTMTILEVGTAETTDANGDLVITLVSAVTNGDPLTVLIGDWTSDADISATSKSALCYGNAVVV